LGSLRVKMTVSPAIVESDVLALDEACFIEALADDRNGGVSTSGERALSSPTTGKARCCARAASGRTTADPVIALMKSRRRIAFLKA
jgi:hypothetical protein